jgi:hypothetical protein
MSVIEDIGKRKILMTIDDEKIELKNYYFPIYPYGNYVADVLELNCEKQQMRCYTYSDSWGGTGIQDEAYISLTAEECEKLKQRMLNVKSLNGFERLVEEFKEMHKRREEEIEKQVNELVEAFETLVNDEMMKKNIQIAKEKLHELVKDFIDNILTDDP